MTLIADILLVSGAIGAGFYCFILARRLSRFSDLDSGMGAAVAILSKQVDELETVLQNAQNRATTGAETLQDLTEQADAVANRLELLVASMHDIPEAQRRKKTTAPPPEPDATFVRHTRKRA